MIQIGIHDLKKVLTRPINVCLPSTTSSTEKFKKGIQNAETEISINDVVIPEGAYYIEIRPLAYNAPININGEDFYLTHQYHNADRINHVFCIQDFVPQVTIVANGNPYIITVAYPSNQTVDWVSIGL